MMHKSLIIIIAFCLVSCAAAGIKPEPILSTWRGVVVFSAGEFQLYETGMPNIMSEGCISGSLPIDHQKLAAEEYNGSAVIVVGSRVRWPNDPLLAYLENKGGRVSNECGGQYVIFASNISRE